LSSTSARADSRIDRPATIASAIRAVNSRIDRSASSFPG